MRKRPAVGAETLWLAILLAAFDYPVFGQSAAIAEPPLALIRATIYTNPSDNPIRDGVVLIRDGKIAAVGVFNRVLTDTERNNITDYLIERHKLEI